MKLFYDDPSAPGLPIDGEIATPNSVGGPDCPVCGRNFGVPLRYPFFVPSKDGSKELKRAYRVARGTRMSFWDDYEKDPDAFWAGYAQFRELIAREAPKASFVPAGTEWGLISLAVDEPVDIAAPNLGVLICRQSIADRLLSDGHKLETYPTLIRSGHKRVKEPYVELFAPPVAHKSKAIPGEICKKCLRFERSLAKEPLPVGAESIPDEHDLFRILEQPGVVFAKESLVRAFAKYYAPNVRWKQAEVD